jgi:hypothetical protein
MALIVAANFGVYSYKKVVHNRYINHYLVIQEQFTNLCYILLLYYEIK